MFVPGSRYAETGTYQTTGPEGTQVTAVGLPLPPRREQSTLLGFHPRQDGQRLDAIADHYLADATAFWRLADAAGAMVPDTLAVRPMIAIPPQGA
jgi:hypothetical protein